MGDRQEASSSASIPTLRDYEAVAGGEQIAELLLLARRLSGKTVKMVSSTALGGCAAETLNRLVPLLNELAIPASWEVVTGGNDFLEVTQAIDGALQGGDCELTPREMDIFLAATEQNLSRIDFPEDVVVVHGPAAAGLIRGRQGDHGSWIWSCHRDLCQANPACWKFLRGFLESYNAAVFATEAFALPLPIPSYVVPTAIDPFSEKNRELDDTLIQQVCEDFGIDHHRPMVLQVARFDAAKDPVGVIEAYKLAKKYVDCQLVLAGGSAAEEPGEVGVLNQVLEATGSDPDIIVLNLPPWSALEINALQRAASVVVHKPIRDGFGLSVTEALWKSKPVIASAVGGIPMQILPKQTGVLVHSIEGCAYQIRHLLTHPGVAQQLGCNGHEHVKQNFLVTSSLKNYLSIFEKQLAAERQKTAA